MRPVRLRRRLLAPAQNRRQEHQGDVVDLGVGSQVDAEHVRARAEVDDPVDDGRLDEAARLGLEEVEPLVVQEELLHREGERQRGDRQQQPLDAQRRQADEGGGHRTGGAGDQEHDEEVPVVVGGQAAADEGADAGDGELAEARSGPTSR